MADVTQEQFERYMEELRANSGAMGKLSKSLSEAHRQEEKARQAQKQSMRKDEHARSRDKLAEQIDKTAQGFQNLQGDTDDLRNSFRNFARMFIGGALLTQMIDGAESLVRTYKDVAESGQTFNGSVFGVARAAAEAGMPLKEFAATLKKNSKVMATYGQKPVMEMAKQVRQNTERFGMYGYTIDGLNDVTMEYMATQRLFGNRNVVQNERTVASAQKLAHQIGALAKTTGESREHILKMTMDAMRDVALTSRFIGNQHSMMQGFSDAAQQSIAIMASLPGEAGAILSKFVSQTVGWGNSLFAQGSELFINAGMGQILGVMDQLQREILKGGDGVEGATWQAIEAFKQNVVQQQDSLRVLAMSGNKEAETILGIYAELQNVTKEKYDAAQADLNNTKNLSAFMLSFSNIMQRLLNSFLGPIFGGMEKMDEKMAALVNSPSFIALEQNIAHLGGQLGAFFQNMKPEDMKDFADGVKGLVTGMFTILTWMGKLASGFMSVVNSVNESKGAFAALVAGLGMIIGGKLLIKAIGAGVSILFTELIGSKVRTMRVTAGRVIMEGGSFGGTGGRGGRNPNGRGDPNVGKGGRQRRPGVQRRANRMAFSRAVGRVGKIGGMGLIGGLLMDTAAGEIADHIEQRNQKSPAVDAAADAADSAKMAAKEASAASKAGTKAAEASGKAAGRLGAFGEFFGRKTAKTGAKAAGKSLLKKIPVIGLGAGALFAAQRMMSGDRTGAGMELASGAASMIPGIGTAASLAMDAAIMARDVVGPENINKAISEAVPKAMEQHAAPAAPKTDDEMMRSSMVAQRAVTERLESENKTAATDPQQAGMLTQQEKAMAMMEAQIGLLKEQVALLKKNNQLATIIAHGMT